MITRNRPIWQTELAQATRNIDELLSRVGLSADALPVTRDTAGFPVRVPRSFIARMRTGDPRDPLLLQVLPRAAEAREEPGFVTDPVGDWAARRAPGILQKYAGRVLIMTTGACAVHCRYCFRRHYPYAANQVSDRLWSRTLSYIREDETISEAILSGGDPLMLDDLRVASQLRQLSDIGHLRRLRIHTRLPVVVPSRITDELLETLSASRLETVVVVHVNHHRELDDGTVSAIARMADAGATLLNQSVLLAGVNDDCASLCALSERLLTSRALPYYLHQLDRVKGAAHFAVSDTRARQLMHEMRASMPGYLVPRLVREVPGAGEKTPL